jgi:hypothetical protein
VGWRRDEMGRPGLLSGTREKSRQLLCFGRAIAPSGGLGHGELALVVGVHSLLVWLVKKSVGVDGNTHLVTCVTSPFSSQVYRYVDAP